MQKLGFVSAAMLLSLLLLGCSEQKSVDKPPVNEPGPVTAAEAKLVEAGNDFTWNLLREVVALEAPNPNKNVFISPLSASIALGMTYNGARGETQTAMQGALGFAELTPQQINESYHGLIDRFSGLDSNVKFQIANSIWHANWFEVESEFLDVNRTYFDAVVSALDFQSPQAVVTINDWVKDKTNGKIEKIVDVIPDDAVMYLINALYFKGAWTYQFDSTKTKPMDFHCPDGSTQSCQFMYMNTDSLRFMMKNGVLGVELPYGNGDYRLLAAIPADPQNSIDEVIVELDQAQWSEWLSALVMRNEELWLPKFKFAFDTKLNVPLTTLGMGVAFTDFADFRGINREGNLAISEVIQKTFVQLDEVGTEAAAVTSVGIRTTSIGPSYAFNRPFLIVIYEHNSSAVLFAGKIVSPEFN